MISYKSQSSLNKKCNISQLVISFCPTQSCETSWMPHVCKKGRRGKIKVLGKGTADTGTDGAKKDHRLICEHTLRVFLRRNNNQLFHWKKEWQNYILLSVMKTTATKPNFTYLDLNCEVHETGTLHWYSSITYKVSNT